MHIAVIPHSIHSILFFSFLIVIDWPTILVLHVTMIVCTILHVLLTYFIMIMRSLCQKYVDDTPVFSASAQLSTSKVSDHAHTKSECSSEPRILQHNVSTWSTLQTSPTWTMQVRWEMLLFSLWYPCSRLQSLPCPTYCQLLYMLALSVWNHEWYLVMS